MKHQAYIIFSLFILIVFSSCGDDAVTIINNDPQNGGPVQTEEGIPDGIPVTVNIGPAGGNLMAVDSTIELIIPPGALNANTDITLQPVTNNCPNGGDNAFRFTPALQFNDSIIMKIKYTQEVNGRLLGGAVQNSGGYWKNIRSVAVDTIAKTMTLKVKSIGAQTDNPRAGGGDLGMWQYIKIDPRTHSMRVNEQVALAVINTAPTGDDELAYLPPVVTNWSKNGPGSLTQFGSSAVYTAPGTVPTPNKITIYAIAKYGGEYFQVQSDIKILGNLTKYHIKINLLRDVQYISGYPSQLTDGADMDVTVNSNYPPTAMVDNIVDRAPVVTPSQYTIPNNGGNVTWVPDDYGVINIISILGIVGGPANEEVALNFEHENTLVPKFHVVPNTGDPFDIGGTPTEGVPLTIHFINNGKAQTYFDKLKDIVIYVTPVQ